MLRCSQFGCSTLRLEFEQLHQAWPWTGLARVGPPTPKHRVGALRASVDPTEARKSWWPAPRERVYRQYQSLIATGVRRDALGIGNGQEPTMICDRLYRLSPWPLRQWSRKAHSLRFPTHAHATHEPSKGRNSAESRLNRLRFGSDVSCTTALLHAESALD